MKSLPKTLNYIYNIRVKEVLIPSTTNKTSCQCRLLHDQACTFPHEFHKYRHMKPDETLMSIQLSNYNVLAELKAPCPSDDSARFEYRFSQRLSLQKQGQTHQQKHRSGGGNLDSHLRCRSNLFTTVLSVYEANQKCAFVADVCSTALLTI